MNEEVAYLILRCIVSLSEEGIGPDHAVDHEGTNMDEELIAEAYRLAGHRLPQYARWPFEPRETGIIK